MDIEESIPKKAGLILGILLSNVKHLSAAPYADLAFDFTLDDPNSAFDGRKANKSGLQNRRGALRKAKMHDFKGHQFLAKFFRQPVFCSVCMEFCW